MAERVFEMLWDCAYCGTRKLLGKTHRFCPKCGAPQDPERRYFPSDEERVAVEHDVYAGADRVCGSCKSAMSALAAHCTQCGAPLQGTSQVKLVADGPPITPRRAATPAPPAGRGLRSCLLPATFLLLLVVVGLGVALFWKKDAQAEVADATWERSIAVETLLPRRDSAWCDSLPRDAREVSRRREVRSQRRVADGEDCATRRVDRGDGTFAERRECTPRYREQPVYDLRCDFTVDRWGEARREVAAGDARTPPPHWPQLALRAGSCRGCEREGARRAAYKVILLAGARRFVCDVSEERWPSFTPGSRWGFKVGVVTGSPDCKSLERVAGS